MKLIMIEDLLDCLGLSFRFDGIRSLMLVGHLHGLHSLCLKFGVVNIRVLSEGKFIQGFYYQRIFY